MSHGSRALLRAEIKVMDFVDRLRGTCCARPEGLGEDIQHWRCGLPGSHSGWHRFRNYVWTEAGHVRFAPTENPALKGRDIMRRLS